MFRRLLSRNRSRQCKGAAWAAREARAQAIAPATAAVAPEAALARTLALPVAYEVALAPHVSACAISPDDF